MTTGRTFLESVFTQTYHSCVATVLSVMVHIQHRREDGT